MSPLLITAKDKKGGEGEKTHPPFSHLSQNLATG